MKTYMLMAAVALAGSLTVNAQSPVSAARTTASRTTKAWSPPRTADGQPDLQGTWVNFDSTPFETPGVPQLPAGDPGVSPPSHWGETFSATSPAPARRQSMIVDPPDGRVPVMRWAEEKRDYDLAHLGDSWVHETPWVRCITRGVPGGMFPAGYNNAYQIVQTPGYVVLRYEMIHEARVIPLDGRPHIGKNIRQWNGDPRGHWENDTLVVDTVNFNDRGSIATSAATGRIRGIPQSEALHVIERFTPVDANTIDYEVTIDDPKVYAKPWKAAMPLTRDAKYQIFEYACQEGNYAVPNELSGGRARDQAAATNPAP
jgi:hypothetical protein